MFRKNGRYVNFLFHNTNLVKNKDNSFLYLKNILDGFFETKVKSTSEYIDKLQKTPRKTPISSMNLL